MSLLQNEDFVLYQLRTAYLSQVKDGVGERLINVDSSFLNNPAFRAAGWVPNAAEIRRTYSPPIPTAVTSDYFQAPRSAGLKSPEGFGEDEDEGGMVTGGGGSNDTVGPTLNTKRRRRKEILDEDDSSDLSDESDEDMEGTHRPVTQIKFQKMPLRNRAGSSPIRGSALRHGLADTADGPSVMVTSPSRPPDSRLRRGSLGAVESIKERARRDTVTSSEMSSENEQDSFIFQKKRVNPHRIGKGSHILSDRNREDETERLEALHEGNESDSSLSSEFSGTADSASLLGEGDGLPSTPSAALPHVNAIPGLTPFANTSPRKAQKQVAPTLQALPPPRPISFIPPISALTQALQAKEQKPSNPLQRFAALSAASEAQVNPIYIRIYCPFSSKSSKPIELLMKKFDDKGEAVTVSEAIGFALWRYQEEKLEPALSAEQANVNCWVLRMYDDGEIDDEFPALTRNKPIMDFASNNSRGMRPRAREKPWDEFGLVKASERELAENEKLTPVYSREAAAALASQQSATESPVEKKPPPKPMASRAKSFRNPITGPSFAPTASRKNTSNLADAPSGPTTHAASRVGAPKVVNVHFTDENFNTRHTSVPCTTDTYIAEVFDKVCRDLHLDKALYVLKVSGSTTVAPSDRTVEALGSRSDLDLIRRRFVGDGVFGLAGSPGSSSPNAPLIISTGGATKKTKKSERTIAAASGPALMHPLSKHSTNDVMGHLSAQNPYYRRYLVTRKQPMSFTSSSSRIIALDNEYMHILPSTSTKDKDLDAATKALFDQSKMTNIHFSSIVGSKVSKKHPRMFRVIVFKERETKRYDFEARDGDEAREIVEEIKKGYNRFQEGMV
ncbi:stress-activated map kinase-interacting protein-like protein [Aaosphaeria arxii CBS 175.79]|uniref:Stress-activated map kinase-interacting protein-like protein n=1 Tax=Aaosphaeria arxii CBS 175.79 TaxID=1450172 RepID=A0A6A5X6P0_9PLEO|nr:stress-activated map kinase-interacting protein-like protein [Aaosphaeria arxii CBS 175.79]KAF2008675.1 stress-activated map kinase-interacting protein-like protein [Aaosphaeria arxii CBS 175.79]